MIGFDSEEIKTEHYNESPLRFMIVHELLEEACHQNANCAVCQVELGPLEVDDNHHCSIPSEIGDQIVHYCAEHCPACKRREDRDVHDL